MGKEHRYFIYLMASQAYGTLYLGVTNDLSRRTGEHRQSLQEGFTAKYGVHRLVWFEEFGDIRDAIMREKQRKGKCMRFRSLPVDSCQDVRIR